MKKEILEIYNEVFRDTDGVDLLTESESKFIRTYMKQKGHHEKNKNNSNKRRAKET
jgi:hypothetical protein